MTDITRRTFIQLSLAGSATAAGLISGCSVSSDDKEKMTGRYGGTDSKIPAYVDQPAGMQDGVPQWYASTCIMCPAGCGIVVRTIGGRAVKIEGNPAHPVNLGATCARGQASLQHLYNPDRLRFPAERLSRGAAPVKSDWNSALGKLATRLREPRPSGHSAVLVDAVAYGQSPAMRAALNEFAHAFQAQVTFWSLIDDAPWRAACRAVYQQDGIPTYDLAAADHILAFNANFLEAWPSPVYYGRHFGEFRQGSRRTGASHGRFVYVGPRMSMTAAKADLWVPCLPGTEAAVALGVLGCLGDRGGITAAEASKLSGVPEERLRALANEFGAAGPRTVAVGGDGLASLPNATDAFKAVESLNAQMGTPLVSFGPASPSRSGRTSYYAGLQQLQSAAEAGRVHTLLIIGQPNPVFTTSSNAFASALSRIPFIAALTPFEDETTAHADMLLPSRTFLEEWSDNAPLVSPPGLSVRSIVQPVIDPSYIQEVTTGTTGPAWMDARPAMEVLASLIRGPSINTGEHSVRRNWAEGTSEVNWAELVAAGGAWPASSAPRVTPRLGVVTPATPTAGPVAPSDTFVLCPYLHLYWADGRHANLPWLQEIPDPMSGTVWNSWVEINLQTASQLGIRTGDMVRLTSDYGSIELPALPYPAIHPQALAVPIGQGHVHGEYGRTTIAGSNPLAITGPIREGATGAYAFGVTRVRLTKVNAARTGYDTPQNTLVVLQDRPGGQEPEAVKDLIHTAAQEAKARSHASQ